MRFDPKLINPDEPPLSANGEIELPGDLAALSEQLRDDAVHLANCYPAGPTQVLERAAAVKRRHPLTIAIGALFGSIIAASLIAVGVFQLAAVPAIREAAKTRPDQSLHSSFVSAPAQIETVLLTELSEPELEALLDLMEREPNTTISVSF